MSLRSQISAAQSRLTKRKIGTVEAAQQHCFLAKRDQFLIPEPCFPHACRGGQYGLNTVDEQQQLGLAAQAGAGPEPADRPDGDWQVKDQLQEGKEREEGGNGSGRRGKELVFISLSPPLALVNPVLVLYHSL